MGKSGIFACAIAACGFAAAAVLVLFAAFGGQQDDVAGLETSEREHSETAPSLPDHDALPFPGAHDENDATSTAPPNRGSDNARHTVPGRHGPVKLMPEKNVAVALMRELMSADPSSFIAILSRCLEKLPADYMASYILENFAGLFCSMLGAIASSVAEIMPPDSLPELGELCRLIFASYKDAALVETALLAHPDNLGQMQAFLEWDAQQVAVILDRLGPGHFRSPHVLFQIVAGLESAGLPRRSCPFAAELLRLQPDNAFAFHMLLAISPEKAAEILAISAENAPQDDFIRYRLGSSLLAMGDRSRAFQSFRDALAITPGDPDYMQGLIEANPAMAAAVLAGEAENDPSDQEAIGKLARAYFDLGRTKDAFELASRAFRMEPDDPEWTDLLMRIDPGAALEEVADMARDDPSDPVLLGLLGRARMKTGDRAGAFEAYKAAYERSGGSVEAHAAWADEMIEADPAKAAELLGSTLGFDARCMDDIHAWKASDRAGLAGAARGSGYSEDFDGAGDGGFSEKEFDDEDQTPAIERMDVGMLGKLGRSMIASGRAADGAALIEYAMARLNGCMFQGVADAARLAGALGRYSPGRAMSVLDGILDDARRSKTPEIIGAVADAYREMGRRGEALAVYREALRADPTNEEWITAIRDLEGRW